MLKAPVRFSVRALKAIFVLVVVSVTVLFAQTSFGSNGSPDWLEHARTIVYIMSVLIGAFMSLVWWVVKKFTDERLEWEKKVDAKFEDFGERLVKVEVTMDALRSYNSKGA